MSCQSLCRQMSVSCSPGPPLSPQQAGLTAATAAAKHVLLPQSPGSHQQQQATDSLPCVRPADSFVCCRPVMLPLPIWEQVWCGECIAPATSGGRSDCLGASSLDPASEWRAHLPHAACPARPTARPAERLAGGGAAGDALLLTLSKVTRVRCRCRVLLARTVGRTAAPWCQCRCSLSCMSAHLP